MSAPPSRRWWRQRKQLATDEWIEEIPYTQANGYTKKVLASYAVYRYLYAGADEKGRESFEVPQRLPAELGSYMKPRAGDDQPIRFEKKTRDEIRKLFPKKKKRKRGKRRRRSRRTKGVRTKRRGKKRPAGRKTKAGRTRGRKKAGTKRSTSKKKRRKATTKAKPKRKKGKKKGQTRRGKRKGR